MNEYYQAVEALGVQQELEQLSLDLETMRRISGMNEPPPGASLVYAAVRNRHAALVDRVGAEERRLITQRDGQAIRAIAARWQIDLPEEVRHD